MKNRITKLFCILILFCISFNLYSQETEKNNTQTENTQETKVEFSQVLKDLRRFEIITFGAMPFVTLDVNLVYSGIRWASHGFDAAYSINLFSNTSYTQQEILGVVLTSVGISLGIAITDYIINLIKRNKVSKAKKFDINNLDLIELEKDEIELPEEKSKEKNQVEEKQAVQE